MSLWESLTKFAQPYSEDNYDEYDEELDGFAEEEEVEERPARTRRTPAFRTVSDDENTGFGKTTAAPTGTSAFSGQVVSLNNKQEVVLFHPANFNETSKAADDLRNKKAVIVNMESIDKAMARRVVDFLSGCAYALDGKVKKVAQATYLFCPHNMEITGDLESLQNEAESYN